MPNKHIYQYRFTDGLLLQVVADLSTNPPTIKVSPDGVFQDRWDEVEKFLEEVAVPGICSALSEEQMETVAKKGEEIMRKAMAKASKNK